LRARFLALALLVLAAGACHAADTADGAYRDAVEDARAGRLEQALGTLRPLVERFPGRQDMLGDYAVVLGWAGDDAAALGLLDKVDRSSAPAYVIEGIASSARRLQRYDLAESLYRETIARFPGRVEPFLGLAEIAVAKRDYFGALAIYQSILARDPAQQAALRGKIQVLDLLGTPQLAAELADRNPGVLTPAEREAIAADRTAHQIRWGAIAADTNIGPARFASIDRALADSDAAGARALDPAASLTPTERTLALDRVGALRVRYRMREAVALYEAMAARPAGTPAYVKADAASAYLYLEQPEKARDLYREAIAADPDNPDSRIGLFYALAESEDHAAALAEIERAVAMTPPRVDAWSPVTLRENPAYARVLSARAMAPLFANRPGEAEQRLHALSDRAPYNMEIRSDYASSMRARGWPRAAETELRWILAADPVNSGALGERAGALREMRDYRDAESALSLAQSVDAEDGRVVRAARLWDVHNLRELVVDGNFGKSDGGPTGTRDYALDAHLYSRPLDYNTRFFAHTFNAEANFDNGTGQRNRAGAGLEYRSTLFVATGELSQDLNGNGTGAAASLAYTPDDHWTFRGTADTSANETPLQASLAGVDARRVSGEAVWRANESRSAALSYAWMNFTDGNRRDTARARWTERVIAGPVYSLEITGALYGSSNSLPGAPYFNPSRDFSPTVEFSNEWIQWRRYTRAFRHRVVVSVGNYWQQGFGTGSLAGARYEQEWEADDRLTVRYGIGVSRQPYDGVQATRDYAYLSLDWKF
jgi:biofilm PGA synthesis protein PgaA